MRASVLGLLVLSIWRTSAVSVENNEPENNSETSPSWGTSDSPMAFEAENSTDTYPSWGTSGVPVDTQDPENTTYIHVTESDQSKMLVSLDYAYSALDQFQVCINEYQLVAMSTTSMANMNQVAGVTSLTAIFLKAAKVTVTLGIKVVTGIFSKRKMDQIYDAIVELDRKLDAIYQQLGDIEKSLKSSIEFNTWMSTYIIWEVNIRTCEAQLIDTYKKIQILPDERSQMKALQEFMTCYENNNIEGSFNSVYEVAAKSSPLKPNIFELYITEHGCLSHEVTRLYFIIHSLMLSATVQMSMYDFLKYANWDLAQEPINQSYDKIYEVRSVYYSHVWNCVNYFAVVATLEMEDYLKYGESSSELQEVLKTKFPLYDWSSAVYKDWNNQVECKKSNKIIGTFKVNLENSGTAFIEAIDTYDNTKGAVALFAFIESPTYTTADCFMIQQGKSRIFLPDQTLIALSNKIISVSTCPAAKYALVQDTVNKDPQCNPSCEIQHSTSYVGYMVGEFDTISDPCAGATCENGGLCRAIPHAPKYYCECPALTDGFHCEEIINPGAYDDVIIAMASTRIKSIGFTGVPDIIDVYFEIRELSDKLDSIHSSLTDDIEFNRVVTLAGNSWSRTSFITAEYQKLLDGKVAEDIFHNRMSQLDNTVYYTSSTNDQLVRGTLAGQAGVDYLTVYKRSVFDFSQGCSSSYVKTVENVKKQIIFTDQVLTEVWIRAKMFKLGRMTKLLQKEVLREIKLELEVAPTRWEEYHQLWMRNSCPSLDFPYLLNVCPEPFSVEGMEIELICDPETVPVADDLDFKNSSQAWITASWVTCQRTEDVLAWDPASRCIYEWGSWTTWSDCSATCDGGTSSRQRHMNNGTTDSQSEPCNTLECCQASHGKYKCGDGMCINLSQVCDGYINCSGGEDETGCNHLQSWTDVRIWSPGHSQYADGAQKYILMSTGQPSSQRFRIKALSRQTNEGIRSGDRVALRYRTTSTWLSCFVDKWRCEKSSCPGSEFLNTNSCKNEQFYIHKLDANVGALIYPTDLVAFKRYSSRYWFSHNRGSPDTVDCPGNNPPPSSHCGAEHWRLHLW